jgi:lipoprotein-anchoring transpeptidase ErfK/SrfK
MSGKLRRLPFPPHFVHHFAGQRNYALALNQMLAGDFLPRATVATILHKACIMAIVATILSGVPMRAVILLPASLLAAALATPCASPARADILVIIDKSTQRMSVSVDGTPRYLWPVSTGRPGYDTPNGTFRPNRMDAEHLSQEWDNAPMPHTIFFDMRGHAIHGFFDVKHLGLAVSHGCVRLAPEHAAVLYDLVSAEGLNETRVVVSGRTPAGRMPEVARRSAPVEDAAAQPMQIAPNYGQQPAPYGQPYYRQVQPSYGQQPYYGQQPVYQQQPQYYVLRPFNPY